MNAPFYTEPSFGGARDVLSTALEMAQSLGLEEFEQILSALEKLLGEWRTRTDPLSWDQRDLCFAMFCEVVGSHLKRSVT